MLASLLLSVVLAASGAKSGDGFHRGVNWVAGREVGPAEIQKLIPLGVSWIAQTPFGWMRAAEATEVRLSTVGGVYWGETDQGLIATHQLAKAAGLKDALKPHLWLHGSWPGAVAMRSEDDWRAWFASYRLFCLHYAELAERAGFDLFVIGTELKATTARRPADWRALITEIRSIYKGPITYAANWDEVFDVPFWDALDFIGVDAYFPLGEDTTVAALSHRWGPVARDLRVLSKKFSRPVLFTEVGYRPVTHCTERPWEAAGGEPDDGCQERAYQAMFGALKNADWLAGIYLWKWFPRGSRRPGFSPQGLPAEAVVGRQWGKNPG